MTRFDVLFLDPAKEFLENLDTKSKEKVLFNIWKSREITDPGLFKKLAVNIWEFRTKYQTKQIRLLAFWDKRQAEYVTVVITHGFIKKSQKVNPKEIEKAKQMRANYLNI